MATEVYELSIHGNHNGEYTQSVLHFRGSNLTADDTFNNAKDLILSWQSNVLTDWLGTLPASWQIDRLTSRRATPGNSAVYHLHYQKGSNPGTFGSIACSYQLCPSVFLVPPMGTKSGGKVFMPAIATTAINSNVYQSAYQTAIDGLFGDMVSNFGTGSITWVQTIYSRKLHTDALVTAWQLSPRIGFQGRRRRPVGS